jgi:beta-N-acetylhexosaminidase
LRDADAVPFHHAIAVGARLMMLSHAMYMNDGGKKPASMSRYITTSRLRKEFNFRGVAISDALESVAWRFKGNTAKACKNTVKAGVDIALLSGDVYAALRCARQIRRAVGNGAISKARLDQAVTRVLKLKAWLGVYRPPSAGRKAAQPSPSSDEEARRPTRAWGWAAVRAPYLLETTSFALR